MSNYKEQNIAVVGLSTEGQDSAKFFVSEEANVTCCDRRSPEELGELYTNLVPLGVSFQLGPTYLTGIEKYDLVVRTQGMELATPEFANLRESGKLTSNVKLFFEECQGPIVGVTGTKGKGTTSTLIWEMLKAEGKRAHLGGNVGTALLSRVRDITPDDWVVMELSSFQLEDLTKSPHVAVVLRITQDHLANFDPLASNYHVNREAYIEAKRAIVRHQTPNDIVIVNALDEVSMSFADLTPARRYMFARTDTHADARVVGDAVVVNTDGKDEVVCTSEEIHLRGIHNLENIAAAALAARAAGVDLASVRRAAIAFEGLEHRLELAGEAAGVSYYNDSFSTVPETTIAAVDAFAEPKVLILGGSEKGADFTDLGAHIARTNVHTAIVIGAMTERIVTALKNAGYKGTIIVGKRNMKDIVTAAKSQARKGDVVILSPACASFDMFKNYKERGRQFKHEVSQLSHI
jgi:UDP-N-acetylmuramoylalanine--D-glutamate ligase